MEIGPKRKIKASKLQFLSQISLRTEPSSQILPVKLDSNLILHKYITENRGLPKRHNAHWSPATADIITAVCK